jgi:hypothetical protein
MTLPGAALFGALGYWLASLFGSGALGPLLICVGAVGILASAVTGRRRELALAARA